MRQCEQAAFERYGEGGEGHHHEDQFNQRVADFEKQYAGQVPDQTSDPSGYKDFQRSVLDYMVTYEIVKSRRPLSRSASPTRMSKIRSTR